MAGFPITPVIRGYLDVFEVHGNLAPRVWLDLQTGYRRKISRHKLKRYSLGYVSTPIRTRDDVRLHFERTLGFVCSHPLRCGFDVTRELPSGCDLSQPIVLSVALHDCASQSLGVWYDWN